MENQLKIGLAQISPVWLNKEVTISKMIQTIQKAQDKGCELLVFGEGLLPGYPFWLAYTHGTSFDDPVQKEIHAHYIKNAVNIEKGDLTVFCKAAKESRMAMYLGIIERAQNRGGHSLYCSLVYIDQAGEIKSVHRKLQPTFEERLTWSPGDGNGLQVHSLKQFTVGGLNCWENWMPLTRTALYGLGEDLHIAVWPGSVDNTKDITRFIARESRSYVVSVSSLMSKKDIPKDTPHYEKIVKNFPVMAANGGSCIAGPNGEWIIPPQAEKEGLITETLVFDRVLEERQNFDAVGHYSRPDVTKLLVNRERQASVSFEKF